jgi:hypothetical protein
VFALSLAVRAQERSVPVKCDVATVSSPLDRVREAAFSVARAAYPEIRLDKLRFKAFKSESVFFKARFSISRYLSFRPMRFIISYNPKAFECGLTDSALRGILAHELAHVRYYTRKNRFRLLGLSSLLSESYTSRFERKADLDAIERGFADDLARYRIWLYRVIDEKAVRAKRVDYLSPEEIRLIEQAYSRDPKIIEMLRLNVPQNEEELRAFLRRCEGKTDCRA